MNKPIKEFKLGMIKAAIWQNEKGNSVTITKGYKDTASNEWKNTNYLNPADCAAAIVVLQKATDYLLSAPRPPQESMQYAESRAQRTETDAPRSSQPVPFDDGDIAF